MKHEFINKDHKRIISTLSLEIDEDSTVPQALQILKREYNLDDSKILSYLLNYINDNDIIPKSEYYCRSILDNCKCPECGGKLIESKEIVRNQKYTSNGCEYIGEMLATSYDCINHISHKGCGFAGVRKVKADPYDLNPPKPKKRVNELGIFSFLFNKKP